VELNKKGIFYTFTAILFIFLTVTLLTPKFNFVKSDSYQFANRLDSMNSFIDNIDSEVKTAIYVSGFRALIALIDDITKTGTFVDDLDYAFEDLMLNGTINNRDSYMMMDNTLISWRDKMVIQAKNIGVDLSINFSDISVYQTNPWEISISVDLEIKAIDQQGIAGWEINTTAFQIIPIIGLNDPVYTIYSGNQINRKINKINFSEHNLDNVALQFSEKLYSESIDAPSFVDRLAGRINQKSDYGIESFIDKTELSYFMVVDLEKSSRDHLYFAGVNTPTYQFSGLPSEFRLDNLTNSQGFSTISRFGLTDYVD